MAKRPYRRSAPNEPWLASGPSENRPWTPREFGILSVITILATATRLFRVEIWPFTADEVVRRATGKPLSLDPYLAYLWGKYQPLYGLREEEKTAAGVA